MSAYTKNESNYIIYSGSGGPYFAKNGSTGIVNYSGSYANARNYATGSLSGTVFDKETSCLEGYVAGVAKTTIDFTGSILKITKAGIVSNHLEIRNIISTSNKPIFMTAGDSGNLDDSFLLGVNELSGTSGIGGAYGSCAFGIQRVSSYLNRVFTTTPTSVVRNVLDDGSGNVTIQGEISGSSLRISNIRKGITTITAQSGSFVHGLSASPSVVFLTASGSAATMYMGALGWYPSGSLGIWVYQTGSGTVAVNWHAEI